MKYYAISKGSEVTGWMQDARGQLLPVQSDVLERDVTFGEQRLDEIQKCSCCENECYVFYHKYFVRLATDVANVAVLEKR